MSVARDWIVAMAEELECFNSSMLAGALLAQPQRVGNELEGAIDCLAAQVCTACLGRLTDPWMGS